MQTMMPVMSKEGSQEAVERIIPSGLEAEFYSSPGGSWWLVKQNGKVVRGCVRV